MLPERNALRRPADRAPRLIAASVRYRPWRLRHLRLVLKDIARPGGAPRRPDAEHLAAAIAWLERAQDVRAGSSDAGGVSAGWSFEDGWLPSYPETTGYIIETFFAAAEALDRAGLSRRAHRMLEWELGLQLDDGAFPGHFGEPGSHPVVFNTGQIMHGLLAGYRGGHAGCLEAAVKAGEWLARHMNVAGYWEHFEHNGIPHVYNTRATWALVRTALLAGDERLLSAARRNLDWALDRQTPSGWFDDNAFQAGAAPFTHTIAYAIRGFLECGALLGEPRFLDAALRAATPLARAQREDGWLAGTFRDGWSSNARYACLTGIAQMSINWLRLSALCDRPDLAGNARRGIEYLKGHHWVTHPDDVVRGGLLGSSPIWGDYSRFEYPNWATKFFADALMMAEGATTVPPADAAPRRASGTV